MPDRTPIGETFANGWRSAFVPIRTVMPMTKRLPDRRLALITAVGIAAVIVAGAFAVGANLGILDASSNNEIGTLDAAGALVPTTDATPAPLDDRLNGADHHGRPDVPRRCRRRRRRRCAGRRPRGQRGRCQSGLDLDGGTRRRHARRAHLHRRGPLPGVHGHPGGRRQRRRPGRRTGIEPSIGCDRHRRRRPRTTKPTTTTHEEHEGRDDDD